MRQNIITFGSCRFHDFNKSKSGALLQRGTLGYDTPQMYSWLESWVWGPMSLLVFLIVLVGPRGFNLLHLLSRNLEAHLMQISMDPVPHRNSPF